LRRIHGGGEQEQELRGGEGREGEGGTAWPSANRRGVGRRSLLLWRGADDGSGSGLCKHSGANSGVNEFRHC
jgi:hypothetical protein